MTIRAQKEWLENTSFILVLFHHVCLRPFQPISCRYKASKWSLRGSLLIETKCYGIDLFRESCSPYIKAIRACLLNTSEICSTGWSPLVWYKFTADLSTTAVMLLFHLKDSFLWPHTHPPHIPHARTRVHQFACRHAHTPKTTRWPLTATSQKLGQVARSLTFIPHTRLSPADIIIAQTICKSSPRVPPSTLRILLNGHTKPHNAFKTHGRILHPIIFTTLELTVSFFNSHTCGSLQSRCLSFWLAGVIAGNQSPLLSQLPCQTRIDWCHLFSGTARSEYTLPCWLWACCRHWLLSVYRGSLSRFMSVTHLHARMKACNHGHTILFPRRCVHIHRLPLQLLALYM